ncbi:MAG: NAD(P)-binding domain-containing protein, partial [Eubacterium sp.]|nr:NAD(P)-binding domain-containing protein [Eubacterium sp.]
MNIGFIGCGNMASAIINGIVNNENEIFEINGYDCYAPALN